MELFIHVKARRTITSSERNVVLLRCIVVLLRYIVPRG